MGLEQPGRYAATRKVLALSQDGVPQGAGSDAVHTGMGTHCSVRASAPIRVSSMWGLQGRLLALRARVLPGEAALTHVNLTTSQQQKALIPACRRAPGGT